VSSPLCEQGELVATLELLDEVERWLDVLDLSNYYELLEILEIANDSAIKQAFHEFSLHFHPDRHRGEPPELIEAITRIYQRGAEAYGVLRDPKMRARYDVALSQGALRYTPGQTRPSLWPEAEGDLESLAVTKGAKLHARQAERALSEGAFAEAEDLIRKSILADGSNLPLSARAQELLELVRSRRIVPG